ncbi:hypothetical protein IFM58399_03813 [Aspergillus lentulus]|uniref:uncharacterized protein n=1 Tax=Aspergillus lentulus TaxID=293939 RepID=UPI0013933BB2|nr:uncharacterized protein IFM58399_03813 [Aspergillus lentulus]KAF4167901.1 hypothetical protein CNMCM6936_004056 [Aspergillus lentulus]KAF4174092.1 hypothetical protein CNMCM8060_009073 [Aspergillus lentulus]KAF4186171.1 hypothetical protein CNMCM7927_005942 [Aspergillus lentulus]KAF4198274.1 hypothetical protein CNMCM8694_000392 [Aspergillus lentulus]GFF34249.1 hypothetical protein IFM58399_03813 [Aspergillus lentulus]
MSVLRHGGSYLQRRLTKMYTDTKTSCESVTTASKAVDDPELVALHRSFRTQRDRLLAWGLDWSDASAAQPNDIDESLTQAGFSDVVESVMSSIQELLSEAERIQHGGSSDLPPKGAQKDSTSKDSLPALPVKTHWTNEDIARSKSLLADLTACIDTLYDLSRSRRNMTSSGQSAVRGRQRHALRTGDESVYSVYPDSKSYHGSPLDTKEAYHSPKAHQDPFDYASPVVSAFEKQSHKSSLSSQNFLIDRSALQLSGASHDNSPPPYEMVAASTNSRAIGRIKTSACPLLAGAKESTVSILVEYTPMMLETQRDITLPEQKRLEHVQQTLDQLVQNARVSHLGLMRFLGFYIDMPNSRYAFIYQMPIDYFPFLHNPSDLLSGLKPKPLVSLFQTGDDQRVPNLETRLRLAYDLLMAALHLRSQNLVHGNINSGNVLIFPGATSSNNDEVALTEDLRRPYLTSFAQFSGTATSPEPLSSSMYRHPDDKRSLEDDAAWSYDLYSLGLVLMEIGLWTPISRLWKMKYTNSMFKQRIENVYLQKLGPKCGSAFLHVVQLCLDAPNFHLSTQPFEDFNLRVPQTFHYPVLDLSAPDGIFSFSMNFLYTMCKIVWSCCRIDIFSAPAAEELDDCLPLALVPRTETKRVHKSLQKYEPEPQRLTRRNGPYPGLPVQEMRVLREKMGLEDKKVKKRTFKKLTNVEIPQDHLNEWNFQMLPRLRKLLQKVLKDSSESCGVTLMMTGESAETAKTTICVTCASAKKVRTALKKYFVLDDREDWDIIVLRGDIQRSKVPRKKRRRPAKSRSQTAGAPAFPERDLNPCYQPRPLCGASIGAFQNDEHLPPVSYGGAILVDGMPYGMTVHHMLEAPSDDEAEEDVENRNVGGPFRSAGNWPGESAPSNNDFMYTWCDEDPSEVDLEFEISEDEDGDDVSLSQSLEGTYDDHWLSDSYSSDEEGFDVDDPYEDEDAASIGDTAGVEPGDEPPLFVTQPAIDDVHEDFFPSPEDRDDEHLASHSLGFVHASSGVRRWTRKGIKHEIDWALIKINDDRLDARNIVFDKTPPSMSRGLQRRGPGGQPSQTGQAIFLNDVARMEELGGLKVHCCGRTSGLQSGQISRAMTIVKLHGRQTFSTSFCVDGNFGVPGDSGAWVFDKSTGRVCGHVLAWSEKSHTAYIAPMEVLLEDIARTLNASMVTLPGRRDESLAFAMAHGPMPEPQNPRYQAPLPLPQQVPVDIGRLSLGLDEPGMGTVNPSRGIPEVSSAPYRGMPPILSPPRSLERQLA